MEPYQLTLPPRPSPAAVGSAQSWGCSASAPPTTPISAEELHQLPYHPLALSHSRDSTLIDSPAEVSNNGAVDPHIRHGFVKALLLVFGVASIAQFALAIALFIHPREFSIDLANEENSMFFFLLPSIANITSKTTNAWLTAAIGLVGLWAWEGHLLRRGTSLNDLGAWSGLLVGGTPQTVFSWVQLGAVPVLSLVGVVGLSFGATFAVTKALTPTPGEVTVNRTFNVPSLYASDPQRVGLWCKRNSGFDCLQATEPGFFLDSLEAVANQSDAVKFSGVEVDLAVMGVASVGVFSTYLAQSEVRGRQFSSAKSFIQARMCMEGVRTAPACSVVDNGALNQTILAELEPPYDRAKSTVWDVSYMNACGKPITSLPMSNNPNGTMHVSTCVDDQNQTFIDWVFLEKYYNHFMTPNLTAEIHVQCAINLEQHAGEMILSREQDRLSIRHPPNPNPCPLTPSPIPIAYNLTWQLEAVLQGITDVDGGLVVIARPPRPVDPITYLEALSGMLYKTLVTLDHSFAVSRLSADPDSQDLLNYNGGGTHGYVVPASERYIVLFVGYGSRLWLVPLALAIAAILASFAVAFDRPLLAFDPADVASVVGVALRSSIPLGRGEEGGRATAAEAERRMWFGEKEGEPGRMVLVLERGAEWGGGQTGVGWFREKLRV